MAKLSQFAQKSLRDSFKDASGMLTGFGQGIPPVQPAQQFNTGGGLGNRHFPVLVEPGETIIPKSQNMLSGGGGITLNIQGDIVTNDAEDFAHRIAEVLPQALRAQSDMGGI